jgi:hypothetical protein
MRFCYADPPYPGQAARHYGDHPDFAGEVEHGALIARLLLEYPDGWALSTNSVSLEHVITRLNANGLYQHRGDYRICAWVKPFASFKPGVNPAYAWEPVILRGGRKRTREQPTVRDWVSANITLGKGLSGAKPIEFCFWLFSVLGMEAGDELADLFPGTGAVTEAWEQYQWVAGSKPCQVGLFAEGVAR